MRRDVLSLRGVLGAALLMIAGTSAAAEWVKLLDGWPVSRKGFAWARDESRGVVVLHGGNGQSGALYDDTWELGGRTWRRIATPVGPGLRQKAAMAYDPVRRKIVLFGGDTGVAVDAQTWEYDGAGWVRVTTAVSPPARENHRMAFLPSLGEIVLFGGADALGTGLMGDTWRYDGTRWLQVAPAASPAPRYKHAMAYDPPLGRIVLFGGDTIAGAGGDSAETWTFDGITWQLLAPGASPPARDAHDLAFDETRGVLVLFGGARPGTAVQAYADTWTFDGATWRQVAAPLSPTPRDSHGLVFDPVQGGVMLFGGSVTEGGADVTGSEGEDSWVFDGATWAPAITSSPPPRSGAAIAFDPDLGRIVLYGGRLTAGHLDDTWQLDASGWSRVPTPTTPGALHQASAAFFEGATTRAVELYGGRHFDGTVSNGLWRLDAGGWSLVPAGAPTPAYSTDLIFDANTRELRWACGNSVVPNPLPVVLDETWEYGGTAFSRLVTPTSPPARYRHAIEYADAASPAGTILFGGTTSTLLAAADTWVLDSAAGTWTSLPITPPGMGRYNHGMAAFPPRGSVVVFGGHVADTSRVALTYELDLAARSWVRVVTRIEPEPRSNFAMEYDASRARIVLFGGSVASGTAGDTWLLLDDRDGDLVGDSADGCPDTPDPLQEDADSDGVGDACDNCRLVANASQLDSDGSCPAPPYATDPACGDACAGAACVMDPALEVQALRVRRGSPAADVEIWFDASLVPARADHVNVYRGTIAALVAGGAYDHGQLPGGSGCGRVAPPAIDPGTAGDGVGRYYLAAPACDAAPDVEGSYGSASPPLGPRPHVDDPSINGAPCP